jgi:endoglucanase
LFRDNGKGMAEFGPFLAQQRETSSMSLFVRVARHAAALFVFVDLAAIATMTIWAQPACAAPFDVHKAINVAQWFTWPRYEASGAGIAWPPYKNTPRPPNAAELQALHQAGFGTVRLPVDPAPFMVFQGERREAVYRMLFEAIERIRGAGLKVIVDLHPNSRHPVWGQNAVVAGLESPTFIAFSNAVEDMAHHLSHFSTADVALELINEPRLKCKGADQTLWQQMLKALIARARAGNVGITLIVTGACISTPDGLIALEPEALGDGNLIYTFHYYEPFTFTHQGAQFIPWPDKYLDGVPWPARARPIEEPLALLAQNVETMTNLDEHARLTALSGARNNLEKFYASDAGPKLIEKRFATVGAWAAQHKIPTSRIFIGEFGVLRQQSNAPGARCADRAQWLADVRSTAERHGFGWSYFNYDGPFSILIDDSNRQLDPVVLASLGLAAAPPKTCQDARK